MNIDCLLIAYSGTDIEAKNEVLNELKIASKLTAPPNMAIAYLGSYLDKKGHSFKYIDAIENNLFKLKQVILENNVHCIGFSTTFCSSSNDIVKIVKAIKEIDRNIPIILGGPYIVNFVRNFAARGDKVLQLGLRMINVDYIIDSYYGEEYLSDLVLSIVNNKNVESIPNIYYRVNGKIYRTHKEVINYPISDYKINWKLFENAVGNNVKVRTATSCPFECSFCTYPANAGNYQSLSVEDIEQVLNDIRGISNVKLIYFIDDTFNIPLDRFKKILKMMIKNRYGFKWHSYIRCQFLDEEAVALMKESGCIGAFLGIESGNESILKIMNKKASISDYRRGISLLNKYKIYTLSSFIIGFPGETENTVMDTIRFLEETKPTFYYAGIWVYDERTPISKHRDFYQIENSGISWSHKTMNAVEAMSYVKKMNNWIKNSINVTDDWDNIMQLALNEDLSVIKRYLKRLADKDIV